MGRSHLKSNHQSFGLLLDLYQLTMAYGFWKQGFYQHQATFHLFYRKPPFQFPFAIAAGLDLAIDLIDNFRFTEEDVRYLGQLKSRNGKPLFDLSFLNYLQRFTFSCDIDAVPEGSIVFPHEPLIRVKGPLIQAQIIESALINVINFSSLIATKAARMVQVAGGEPIIEFGLRRAQGIDGALTASRAAYIGGCAGTSNVLAGKYYHIPVKGTHAHSWVMVFGDELTAFQEYARALPHNCIFLVDTYDTIEGVNNAIRVGRDLRQLGHELIGIRLDSGDLASLSKIARQMLDEAGFEQAIILAGNDLDEHQIETLHKAGSAIDAWGIGTRLVTGHERTSLDGVYKLAAVREKDQAWQHRLKLSEESVKTSNPGVLQVKRLTDRTGLPIADLIYDELLPYSQHMQSDTAIHNFEALEGQDMLLPVFQSGKCIYESPSLSETRDFSLQQQALFQRVDLSQYQTGLEQHLYHKKKTLIEEYRQSIAVK